MMQADGALPQPDNTNSQRSRDLTACIAQLCEQQGGSIAFSDYMRMALYQPGMGYYSSGLNKFGQSGDFITAPEVSSLFSRCLARQIAQVFNQTGVNDVLEFGAGSGLMAVDILLELEQQQALPMNYYILELSAELRQRQQQTVADKAPHLLVKVHWLDALPQQAIEGVVIANELLDAMPVECFRIHGDVIEQLRVTTRTGQLRADYQNADDAMVEQVRTLEKRRGGAFPQGYCSEFNPAIKAWLASLYDQLGKALVLLIDYGYPVTEYYLDERDRGTLICHYQHRAHSNPLWYPGLQDITAFVDFSAVAHAADEVGFDVSGYTTQAMFLMGCGLGELHQSMVSEDQQQQLKLAQQIKTLTLPSEMGERFKAMALSKQIELPLIGFS
ncbi:MAG: SAM-dependent methyltransferase, partial [Gammaproteobacteria bacterium]|nr:SAM-dependent methyltransferase [Gammaproteobacteria bacterium]